MDKNTIWAIVLSTLVIVASYLLLPRFFGKKTTEAPAAVEITAEDTQTNQAEILILREGHSLDKNGVF